MASVVKGGFGSSSGSGNGNGGTEFVNVLPPPKGALDGYDNTLPCSKQTINVPQIFQDAMAVREEVYGEQGVPLEAEFDEDDARSWHWVAYASVATSSGSPPKSMRTTSPNTNTPADDARRASATASRVPVATIRLIPPPHGPNKYLEEHNAADKHPDADPADEAERKHTSEPYVKLGRLAVLTPYRKLGLGKLLINSVFDFATHNSEKIYRPPSPTALEMAQMQGQNKEKEITWKGLVMIHAQANIKPVWEKHGFREELVNEQGEVEVSAEPHWIEEGIEHIGMWKRLQLEKEKRLSLSLES